MLDAIDLGGIGIEFILGAILGGVTGYAYGKVARTLAALLVVELALFRFLEAKGIVVVRWDRLSGGLVQRTSQGVDQGWIPPLLSVLAVGTGFAFGFALGLKES